MNLDQNGRTGVDRPTRPKKHMKIRWQIALGFGIFILIIAVLLWTFQIALLGPFYRQIKTAEVKAAAESIIRQLESSDERLEAAVEELCYNTGLNIVVSDELGRLHANCFSSQKSSPLRVSLEQSGMPLTLRLHTIFENVNLEGGSRTETFQSDYFLQNGAPLETILYARTVRTDSGSSRLVLLESEITPVDSTVETLRVQLGCVTVVMVLLGALLAWIIARRISRPLTAINQSAKALGQGDYDIRFAETGSEEVSELAQTLNFAAEELSKVEGLRRELLANVSHDLRTPLTMIQGYSEVMRDLPGENTPENVQIIIDETKRLTDLVNDLLDLSRLESGVVALDRTTFNLTAAIRAILTRYDKLADFSFPFLADREVSVYADELKISQVVYNLVNNAITYAGEDKTVFLRQEVRDGRVRISVTDHGQGIPADKLKDIWERYYKVDKEHKRAQVGTGLGLSIVKNILDMHGGAYGVESELGKGSTFWFELSLERPEAAISHPETEQGPLPPS